MRFILLICLVLSSFAAQAQTVMITLENANGRPFIKWNPDPNFSYSIYRRHENTDYELVESGYKGGWYTDKTAENSTQYYYKVVAESKELKLSVATILLKSFDLTDPENHKWLGGNVAKTADGLTFTPHKKLSTVYLVSGIKLDQTRKYTVKYYLGNIEAGNESDVIFTSLGNVPCINANIKGLLNMGFANSVYECVVDPKATGKTYTSNDIYTIFTASSFKVEIKKIEIMGFDN